MNLQDIFKKYMYENADKSKWFRTREPEEYVKKDIPVDRVSWDPVSQGKKCSNGDSCITLPEGQKDK